MKASKMVVSRERSARKVAAAGMTHMEAIGRGVGKLLGRQYGRSAEQIAEGAAQKLTGAADAMVAADEAHIKELSDDPVKREKRDEVHEALHGTVVDFRELSTTVYGRDYVSQVGFEGRTPEDPMVLVRLAERVVGGLESVPLPKSRFAGMTVDMGPWKEKITAGSAALKAALGDVDSEARESEQTLVAKQRAIEDYAQVFSKTANLLSALLTIAGEQELADRLRPSGSKPGQTAEPTVTEEA